MSDTHQAIEAVWRIESARLVAGLVRLVRDIGLAEELAQDALVAALEQWPSAGVPRNPGAWLMTTAKRRGIDLIRRSQNYEQKLAEIGRDLDPAGAAVGDAPEDVVEDAIEDDLLRLVFVSCHPVLSTQARTALTLRLLGGLSTDEIARAFLASESTVAQRIVRAKKTIAEAGVPFEVPSGPDREARVDSVLEVVYLIFNEGYSATAGSDWMRPTLCEEALRLVRVLQGLMPSEPEVHGLAALLEIQASRLASRVAADGAPVLLLDQDRRRWDKLLIRRGLSALDRATALGGGRYTLQAAIAACHARAAVPQATDWARIAALYADLAVMTESPVVELNRAVAVSMAYGPGPALEIVDQLGPALEGYHLLPSVRGDLLAKLGRYAEAREEFEQAAAQTRNEAERTLLLDRAAKAAASAG